jgi:hypothetical protein
MQGIDDRVNGDKAARAEIVKMYDELAELARQDGLLPPRSGGNTIVDHTVRKPDGSPTVTINPENGVPYEVDFSPLPLPTNLTPEWREIAEDMPIQALPANSPWRDGIPTTVGPMLTSPGTPVTTGPAPETLEQELDRRLAELEISNANNLKPSFITIINPFTYVGLAGQKTAEWVAPKWIEFKKSTDKAHATLFPWATIKEEK